MKRIPVRFGNIFSTASVVILTFICSSAHAAPEAILFGYRGDYVVLDTKQFDTLKTGRISGMPKDLVEGAITEMTPMYRANLMVIRMVKAQSMDLADLALNVDKKEILKVFSDGATVIDNQILVTHQDDANKNRSSPSLLVTDIYDPVSLKKIGEIRNKDIYPFGRAVCIVDDRAIYTGAGFFDMSTGRLLRKDKFAGKGMTQTDCKSGRVLMLSDESASRDPKNPKATLTLYDLKQDKVLNTFSTGMRMYWFRGEEWSLTPDGKTVVHDEFVSEMIQGQRTTVKPGHLYAWDAETGKQVGDLLLPVATKTVENRLLGFSEDGKLLFYGSAKSVFVVDVAKWTLVKEIPMSTRPVGVYWPIESAAANKRH